MMHRVVKYDQFMSYVPQYRFAPKDIKQTELFFPEEKFILYITPSETLCLVSADKPRLIDSTMHSEKVEAENVTEIELDDELYKKTVEMWKHQQAIENLSKQLPRDYSKIFPKIMM